MNKATLFPISLAFLIGASMALAQSTDPSNKPSVTLENNRPKALKPSNSKIIEGTVKDGADNPVAGAIVQLKNTKTSRVVDFATKDDGKFAFRELPLDADYELLAKRGDLATPVKKVSVYDSRKEVVINFKLEKPEKK